MEYEKYNCLNINYNIEKNLKENIKCIKDNLILTISGKLWKLDEKDNKLLKIKFNDKLIKIEDNSLIIGENGIYKYDSECNIKRIINSGIDYYISSTKDFIIVKDVRKTYYYSFYIYNHKGELIIPYKLENILDVNFICDIDGIDKYKKLPLKLSMGILDYKDLVFIKINSEDLKYVYIYQNTLYKSVDREIFFPLVNIKRILYKDQEKMLLNLESDSTYYNRYVLIDYDANILNEFNDENFYVCEKFELKSPYLVYSKDKDSTLKGVIDIYGKEVVSTSFLEIVHLKDEYFYYETHDDCGIYNMKNENKKTIDFYWIGRKIEYDKTSVMKYSLYGIMDLKGNLLVDFISDIEIKILNEKYYIFKKNGKYGIGDFYSNSYNNAIYDSIEYSNGFIKLVKNNECYLMNLDGKIVRTFNSINSENFLMDAKERKCMIISYIYKSSLNKDYFFEIYNENLEKKVDTTKCNYDELTNLKLLSDDIIEIERVTKLSECEQKHFWVNDLKNFYTIFNSEEEKSFKTLKKLKKYEKKLEEKHK